MSLLNAIDSPADLRQLKKSQLGDLASELREFIIDAVATKAGHLGASLGVVELTIALHYVFNTPEDVLLWDVGHQAYGHKILTGRRDLFKTNRQWEGISGFPKRSESVYDSFGTGHSSTAISAALGMAMGHLIRKDTNKHCIAVVGDAAISSGMALEGLNHAGATQANLLVILNDNSMGIDPSVGALKNHFTELDPNCNLFTAFNFEYTGPIDGHNLEELIEVLEELSKISGPKLLHIKTTKGKGLAAAEKDQISFHAPGTFDKNTGMRTEESNPKPKVTFSDVFGRTLVELARINNKIVGVSPAMATGSKLNYMMSEFPDRSFDVGIAEQHAVTLSAGLACEGFLPYCVIYSTFLQRAIDQVIHDVALQNLRVVFCIDRAGLVGADGATHQGVFDIALLKDIPNLSVAAPIDEIELRNLMFTAQEENLGAIAIRYPRGATYTNDWQQPMKSVPFGKGIVLKEGSKVAVLSTGIIGNTAQKVITHLGNDKVGHIHFPFVKPLDIPLIEQIAQNYEYILTLEDGSISGGFGSQVAQYISEFTSNVVVKSLGVPDDFVEHGNIESQQKFAQIDFDSISNAIKKCL